MIRLSLICCVGFVAVWMIRPGHELLANQSRADKPNIVLILADDLGINDLGCQGRQDQRTPHLDALARQGLRFTAAYAAQSVCSPSRAAMMTGKSPAALHLTTFLPGRSDAPSQKLLHPKISMQLPLEEVTLAERLKAAGYTSAQIGKWHLGGRGFGPLEQGFDMAHAGQANTAPTQTEGGKGEFDLTSKAREFIIANKDRPFFLYLNHNNPHVPLAAQGELVKRYEQAGAFNPIYAAMIETLDESIGQLLQTIHDHGLDERTIVLFTSDNGGLHVLETPHTPATHNTPFRAGKGFLYEGGVRIPLIIRWTGRISPGVIDVPVIHTDFPPTLMELAGLQPPTGLEGLSLAPLILGRSDPRVAEIAQRPLFWHCPHYTNQGGRPSGAMRQADWKIVLHYDTDRVELFNLARDPSETTDLAGEQRDRADRMRRSLERWLLDVKAQRNRDNPGYKPDLGTACYVTTDVSKLKAATTAAEMAAALATWRRAMDDALPRTTPTKKAAAKKAQTRKPAEDATRRPS